MRETVKNILQFINENIDNGIIDRFCNINPYFGIYVEDSNKLSDFIYIGTEYTCLPDFESMKLFVENNETGKKSVFKITAHKHTTNNK